MANAKRYTFDVSKVLLEEMLHLPRGVSLEAIVDASNPECVRLQVLDYRSGWKGYEEVEPVHVQAEVTHHHERWEYKFRPIKEDEHVR